MTRLLTLVFLLACSTQGFAGFYQAPLQQTRWEFKQTGGICYLRQAIPLYGSADFVQKPGEPLRFSIQEQRKKPLIIKASLKIRPAPWMHDTLSSLDYPVYREDTGIGGDGRLSVYGDAAESMIDALLQGHYPTFIYIRDAAALNLEETQVAVSAVKFAQSYQEFLKCRNGARPVSAQNRVNSGVKSKQSG